MKYLCTIAVAAACSLALPSSAVGQDVRIQAGAQGFRDGYPSQFSSYNSDSYGRRLNRYQQNYGYNNYRNRDDGFRQYGNSGPYGYRTHDYYGSNYGRVRGYRDYYGPNQFRGYNNGYYSRPGFSIGGGSSRVYFGF